MRLSQAIRLGAMLRPQAFGAYVTMDGKTCAMGAGLEAAGALKMPDAARAAVEGDMAPDWDQDVEYLWPWVVEKQLQLRCPICVALAEPVEPMGVILHLNDRHQWTRERIADWVEGVEPKEGAKGARDERKAEADDRRIPDGAPGARDEACIGV